MILEGLITTENADGTTNIAPLGPVVDEGLREFRLRPFQTSTTFENLKRTRRGVFHVTDDVELLARTAVGAATDPPPRLIQIPGVHGQVLADACRWYGLEVNAIDDRLPRAEMPARVVASGRLRDFWGFNRAKHAVVEAAILATRIGLIPLDTIDEELRRLHVLVEKTGGPAEHRAFEFLVQTIRQRRGEATA